MQDKAMENLNRASENRRRLQAEGADQATIERAISIEKLARHELQKFAIATMANGFAWNR